MSIGTVLTDQLAQLAAGKITPARNADGTLTLSTGADADAASLTIFEYDRFSATLRTLAVGSPPPPDDDRRAFLSARAAAIARRLSFLEEPLAVWELDGREGLAQLRSSPPQRDGECVEYWEVELFARPASATLTRYRWAPGMAEREVVAYPAAFGLLGRIADALAAAVRGEG
jgi:hypothetical protein